MSVLRAGFRLIVGGEEWERFVEVGTVLAERYRLGELLGRGGMGEVWCCRDLRLGRDVAVKVLLATEPDPDDLRRFRREAEAAAALRHPGITVVFDIDQSDGRMFIVTELLHGQNLARFLAAQPGGLPVGQALGFGIEVADALAHAHGQGIVHRDLKPLNLFVQDGGPLKVCDFGVARDLNATSSITGTGLVLGSPAYMSPEQWEAEPGSVGMDLYALGCILYEMLTGRLPFAGPGLLVLMRQHLSEAPIPPRDHTPQVPGALSDLVDALLAKNPKDRPSSASAVRDALIQIRDALGAPGEVISPLTGPVPIRREVTIRREVRRERRRATLLLEEALRIAYQNSSEWEQASMMARAAEVMVRLDHDRAARLAVDAERAYPQMTARGHESPYRVMEALAVTDPDVAEQAARSIPVARARDHALQGVAVTIALADPARAERLVHSMNDGYILARSLVRLGVVARAVDPDRAARLIAEAERLARADPNSDPREFVLCDVAVALAPTDPDRAERIAYSIPPAGKRAKVLADVARELMARDPARAAQLIADAEVIVPSGDVWALGSIAQAVAVAAPDRAERIARSIRRVGEQGPGFWAESALADVATVVAGADPERAERIARSLTLSRYQGKAWASVMENIAATDLHRAEQVARSISGDLARARAIIGAAKGHLDHSQTFP